MDTQAVSRFGIVFNFLLISSDSLGRSGVAEQAHHAEMQWMDEIAVGLDKQFRVVSSTNVSKYVLLESMT